jgi:hypothetical protein
VGERRSLKLSSRVFATGGGGNAHKIGKNHRSYIEQICDNQILERLTK